MYRFLRRIIPALLVLLILLSFSSAEESFGGFTWTFGKNKLTINGEGSVPYDGPWNAKAKNVKTLELGEGINEAIALPEMKNLTSIIFHSNEVVTISFENCKNITELTYTSDAPVFRGEQFRSSRLKKITFESENADYVLEDNILYSKDHTILYYFFAGKKNDFEIPDTVKIIGAGAFANSKIKSVTIPDSVERIEDAAFFGCKSLKNVTIPASVWFMGDQAFAASGLEQVEFLGEEISYEIEREWGTDTGSYQFYGTNIKEIKLPRSSHIPEGMLGFCKNLKRIEFAEGTTLTYGFYSCPFHDSNKVEYVYIPDSMQVSQSFFKDIPSKCTVYCHAGSTAEEVAKLYNVKYEIIE